MKLTDYNLQENRQNHTKHRNFFENKYLILCALCDLGGFVKFGLNPPVNLRKITTKLCKTNPNSKMPKLTHALFYKGLMKIFAPSATQKTNPKQTQTKPICKRAKMNTTSVLTNGYKNKSHWRHQKNKAKSNPILKKSKLNITSVKTNSYENKPPWKPKKTNPNQTQFPQSQKQRIFGQFMYAAQRRDRRDKYLLFGGRLVRCLKADKFIHAITFFA